ncbi:hypothetical protein RFI_03532 [Reticulomyxa filosa]|uniref:Alpha-ketoglutarate-dependent dioxygenase AlkB-like domain-containing protein n=1 Tax=Reticulomyxa filosa TaxID=46433 RepID=X6P4V2_RETFI|nr:hypothetical protein RFI_03532 [Reticulomyxa filosa]|eukprot:ETO33570.1 hypothetical protein RFI_03532 [Reticulomyxa filosa]
MVINVWYVYHNFFCKNEKGKIARDCKIYFIAAHLKNFSSRRKKLPRKLFIKIKGNIIKTMMLQTASKEQSNSGANMGSKPRTHTVFGQYEKVYRRPIFSKVKKTRTTQEQKDKETLKNVVDFRNIEQNTEPNQSKIRSHTYKSPKGNKSGTFYEWSSISGLYIFPNYLNSTEQAYYVHTALKEFSTAPYNNMTNNDQSLVTTTIELEKKEEEKEEGGNKQNDKTGEIAKEKKIFTLWQKCVDANDLSLFEPLAWSNVGVQYDWTLRKYNTDVVTHPIPQAMIDVCTDICACLQTMNAENDRENSEENSDDDNDDSTPYTLAMVPQTSIINYYCANTKRPMGGHRDAAEKINAPLVSISLGCTAIFLIADGDEDIPVALYLRSGDCLVMSKSARFALHAVARVIPDTCPSELVTSLDALKKETKENAQEIELMKKYIVQSRLNFNVRQVV